MVSPSAIASNSTTSWAAWFRQGLGVLLAQRALARAVQRPRGDAVLADGLALAVDLLLDGAQQAHVAVREDVAALVLLDRVEGDREEREERLDVVQRRRGRVLQEVRVALADHVEQAVVAVVDLVDAGLAGGLGDAGPGLAVRLVARVARADVDRVDLLDLGDGEQEAFGHAPRAREAQGDLDGVAVGDDVLGAREVEDQALAHDDVGVAGQRLLGQRQALHLGAVLVGDHLVGDIRGQPLHARQLRRHVGQRGLRVRPAREPALVLQLGVADAAHHAAAHRLLALRLEGGLLLVQGVGEQDLHGLAHPVQHPLAGDGLLHVHEQGLGVRVQRCAGHRLRRASRLAREPSQTWKSSRRRRSATKVGFLA
jgi:hypothetical protein